MLKGIFASNDAFNIQLNRVEQNIADNNRQITSGLRVNQAQDDPYAIQQILSLQDQLNQVTQVQTNMNLAKTDASAADNALSTAGNILDQLISIGSQGSSDLTQPEARANLVIEATQLSSQLVEVANTQVGSRFIFGGDAPSAQPVTVDPTTGVRTVSTVGSTNLLRDSNGNTTLAAQTANQIFNDPTSGIFAAQDALVTALQGTSTSAVQTALTSLKSSASHLANSVAFYGNVERWIDTVTSTAQDQSVTLQSTISGLRDTDIPTAITRMTSDQTALQAALAAHASLSTKTLFDHLG